MPFFEETTPETDLIAQSAQQTAAPTRSSQEFAYEYTNALANRSLGEGIAAFVGGSVLDLADTVSSSIVPGVERGEVNEKFLSAFGSPGLTKWFHENKGAAEAGSGILGIIAADYVAGRILKPAGIVMQGIRDLPYAKRIATLDAQYNRAKAAASMAQREVAERGLTGVDRFIGGNLSTTMLGVPVNLSRGETSKNLFKAALVRGGTRNLTTEGVMAATLHSNEFLYSDDLSHNLAWGAAGLALGGAFDTMISAYTLRKMANSETIRQLNRKAYDISGFETQRLAASSITNDILKSTGLDPNIAVGEWRGSGGLTDVISSTLIQAAENRAPARGVSETAQALGREREKTATHLRQLAYEDMQKVTTRGIRGVSGSGFHMDAEGLGAPVKQALYREPVWAKGLEEIGTPAAEMSHLDLHELRTSNIETRLDKLNKVLDDGGTWLHRKNKDGTTTSSLKPLEPAELKALQLEAQELNFAKGLVPKVMLEPGEWAPLSHAQIADKLEPRNIVTEGGLGKDNRAVWQAKPEKGKSRLGFSSDGEIFLPSGVKRIENLSNSDLMDMYRIGRQAVKHFQASGEKFIVPENANWFVLDVAEQIAKAANDSSAVVYPSKMTRETALVESFAQKVDAFKRKENNYRRVGKLGVDTPLEEDQLFKLKVALNLPRVDPFTSGMMGIGESGVDILLGGFKNGDEVRKVSHEELLKGLNDIRRIQGLTDETVDSLKDLHGNSFNFLMDEDGNFMKPIIGYQRPMNPFEWTRDDLFVRQATKAAVVRNALVGPEADAMTREMVEILSASPSFSGARKVMELADDQHRSFVPGFTNAAPQTTWGSLINAVTSRGRRDVDSPIMRFASEQQELKTRIMQAQTKEIIEQELGDSVTRITSARNERSLMLINQLMSHGHGWEFADELAELTLPNGEKAWALVLDHKSQLNQDRFKDAYGRDLSKGQQLLNPNGQNIVLDELSREVFVRTQGVHHRTLGGKNTILRSQNLPEIKAKKWYIPPPSTKGKYVSYTFDMQNNVVPGMTVIADSPQQMDSMIAALEKSPQWKDGYRVRSKDDVSSFMTLWDKAQMDYVAPNVTAIQPKKHNYGLTSGNTYNARAFEEGLITMRDSLMRHGDDVIEILFDDVIKAAKVRAKMARVESAVGRDAQQHSSIYDRFVQNLTGKNSLGARDSFFGDLYGALEDRMNGLLKGAPGIGAAKTSQAFSDFIRMAAPGKSTTGEQFRKLSSELGNYMPFKSVSEMVEAKTQGRMPSDVAGISSKLSQFESGMRLRWFESMHAVVNVASILANTPAVIRSLQPRVGESIEEAALRNGTMAMVQRVEGREPVIVPNTMKLIWQAGREAWGTIRGKGNMADEFTKKAFRLGYMDQEVSEAARAFGSIESQADWRKWAKDIDKWVGFLSDKSEAYTRQWGMMIGRNVAQSMGIQNVDAQLQFSHEITNKLIANYDPRNRPEVFQGALGAPIGLFQSYVFNFYERMFRYIETADKRSLATQMAMQVGIFGTTGVPGWEALNWAFFDQGQAKGQDPVESLYGRFGTADGDMIMHGVLSNLPKIFGADGVSLYTRGDMAVRLPGTQWTSIGVGGAQIPAPNLPVFDTLKRLATGVSQGIGAMSAEGTDIGSNHLAEILSNTLTNRPIAGLIELVGAKGYDTSVDGQVVSQAKTTAEQIYRVLGVRSMAQQKSIDNFYSSKTAEEEQKARRSMLTQASRAAVRAGKEERLEELFAKYVQEGGDPRYYTRWRKDIIDSAMHTRSERALAKALKDKTGRSDALIARLLDGQVDVAEDENATDDYGRNAQIEDMAAKSWEATPNPIGNPVGEEWPGGNPNQPYGF